MDSAGPERRWRAPQLIGAIAAVLALVGVVAAISVGNGDEDRVVRVGAGAPTPETATTTAEPTTTTIVGELIPETTTTVIAAAPTPAPAPAPAVPKPAAPATTAAPRPRQTAPAPSGNDTGRVITFDQRGIYALDIEAGATTRLTDALPFDVAGRDVLTASGATVHTTPVSGGDRRELYTVADVERIDWLEATDDATAMLRISGGSYRYNKLVGPDGKVRVDDLPVGSEVEWSNDGSVLVTHNYQGVHGFRRTGERMWGPVAAPESIMKGVRVSHDGAFVAGEFNSHAVKLLDVAKSSWSDAGVWRSVSFGPGPRLMGQPTPPPGWDGRTPLGIATWSVADGSTTPYCRTGSEPYWSPDGNHAVLLDAPVVGTFDGNNFSYRVRGPDGAARYTLSAPGMSFGRDAFVNNIGPAVLGPQWTSDGRHLVFGVI